MAEKPIAAPLPADLPDNWTYGQTVAPAGSDAGLTEQHGYNYLMEQVNAAQEAVNAINEAFSGLASVGEDGKVPEEEIPELPYIPSSQKGQAGGVATLGADGQIAPSQVYNLLLSVSAAADYSASATYSAGDFCTREGQLYKANQDISTAEPWTAAHWTATSIMAEVAALNYDPAGTANTAVSQHNQSGTAHPDIRAAMVTAVAQVSYNAGGGA